MNINTVDQCSNKLININTLIITNQTIFWLILYADNYSIVITGLEFCKDKILASFYNRTTSVKALFNKHENNF